MGNLRDARGVYAIIHFMTTFADWGIKEYEPWFRQEILAKYWQKTRLIMLNDEMKTLSLFIRCNITWLRRKRA